MIVSAGGEVSDVKLTVSTPLQPEGLLYHIDFSCDDLRLGGSAWAQSQGRVGSDVPTVADPDYFRAAFRPYSSA